jgi:hypothetical protein
MKTAALIGCEALSTSRSDTARKITISISPRTTPVRVEIWMPR